MYLILISETTPFTIPITIILYANNGTESCKDNKNSKMKSYTSFLQLSDESCNFNMMIEFVTIRKLKG